MTYNELLQQKEWWSKCNEILSRDHYICRDCGCLGYHNGCYAVIEDMNVIDSIFSQWTIDGLRISQFCSNLMDYDLEHFEDVELKKNEPLGQDHPVVNFKLFSQKSDDPQTPLEGTEEGSPDDLPF